MPTFFTGHRDSVAINDYLNKLDQESNDFLVVFHLRRMGEAFVDGRLEMAAVRDYAKYIPASEKAEAFIRQMRCYTFYSALCNIALEKPLSSFEQTIKEEITAPRPPEGGACSQPSVSPATPWGMGKILHKMRQIWYGRWKHPLVFNEYWLPALITMVWSVVRRREIVKD